MEREEVGMWSVVKRTTLIAVALLAFAGTASAAVVDVKVPFPFVAQGHQFPAGQYRVQRDDADPSAVLIREHKDRTAVAFVLTTPAAAHDPAGDKPALIFERYEKQYRLASIWESAGQGREVDVRK
jgi:hypothetical protein